MVAIRSCIRPCGRVALKGTLFRNNGAGCGFKQKWGKWLVLVMNEDYVNVTKNQRELETPQLLCAMWYGLSKGPSHEATEEQRDSPLEIHFEIPFPVIV